MKKIKIIIFLLIALFLFFIFALNLNHENFDKIQNNFEIGKFLSVFDMRQYFEKNSDENLVSSKNNKDNIKDKEKKEDKKLEEFEQQVLRSFEESVKKLDNYDLLKNYDEGNLQTQIVTNNQNLVVFRIVVPMVEGSNFFQKYYNIDKKTGEIIKLGDLFENDDYIKIISAEIKSQIAQQIKTDPEVSYFEDIVNELEISSDQQFYINNNRLVIVFDKYEIAPGYMGCLEFEISEIDLNYLR